MTATAKRVQPDRRDRPATGPQLWRLNAAGLLHELVEAGKPVTVGAASEAIARLVGERGSSERPARPRRRRQRV